MQTGEVIQLLGLVVAVMLVQVLINLASGVQDLYSKLLAGHIIYMWSKDKAADTTSDTNLPTGAFIKVKDRYGRERLVAADPDDVEDPDEQDAEHDEDVRDEYWKSMLKGV